MIKISNVTYNDIPVNAIGLNDLLANVNLWEEKSVSQSEYTRKVYRKNGKTITELRRCANG